MRAAVLFVLAASGTGVAGELPSTASTLDALPSVNAPLTAPTAPGLIVGLPPCRAVDTRPGFPSEIAGVAIGPFSAGEVRTYGLASVCGVPPGAIAVSVNVTAVGTGGGGGFLSIGPGGAFPPATTSTINWTSNGQIIANAALVPLDTTGQVSVIVANPTDVLIDVNGYVGGWPTENVAFDLTVSGTQNLPFAITEFRNLTVNAGATLNVPSGAVIRCLGTFTNNGTIQVGFAAFGGLARFTASVRPSVNQPGAGLSLLLPATGEFGDNTVVRGGGLGGAGFDGLSISSHVLHPGLVGGGGGAGGWVVNGNGGNGGGFLTILARGAIVNGATGVIRADGTNGGTGAGGGAGGVLLIASMTSIQNDGLLSAKGGTGGPFQSPSGTGGGGGGGLIYRLAPALSGSGAADVAGGTGGAAGGAGSVAAVQRAGGAGGGACAGGGGQGGQVNTDGSVAAGGNGLVGATLGRETRPAWLVSF